ncbi:MAG: hydantoinase/oxoprolinase family protein, partial [Thermoplasmata archaeon]|nr:hydantoinase/oxoprolinase family protein [Thermoplasmata archaeon]
MARIGLGFDTGGTYTDAVVMDLGTGEILGRSKSLTTRNDLSIGIRGAIEGFDRALLDSVDVVFLSSTLATNSVVEGKGCRVGLIVMGSRVTGHTTASYSITIGGRHGPSGKEEEPLDEDAARAFLESLRGKVDCIAVTGFMSVRNPAHERRVKEMALEILGVPTVCGYELSSSLGFNERTVTCVMNARLIPVIEELLRSVNRVMSDFGIDAPLMIVRGDGSVMSEDMARERPVETILSGPASSMNGASRLTGLKDAVVVDIGGTTTDIGLIRDGRPNLSAEGALIGGFRTRVTAAEITTAGMGGDSRIVVNGRKVSLSPLRIMPLCMASWKYPGLRERLQALVAKGPRDIPGAH